MKFKQSTNLSIVKVFQTAFVNERKGKQHHLGEGGGAEACIKEIATVEYML